MKKILVSFAGALAALAMTAPAHATVVTVNFDALDTTTSPVSGTALDTYLGGFGITLGNVTATTTVAVKNPSSDTNVVLTSPRNYLSQWWAGVNGTSFELQFATPLDSLSVTIPLITSGVIIPEWRLTALDAGNASLGSFASGGLEGSPRPARTFTFAGPGITALEVYSNVHGVAGMGGIPIDDVMFAYTAVPEPTVLALLALGLSGIGWSRRKARISLDT